MMRPFPSALFTVMAITALPALMSCSGGNPSSSVPEKGLVFETLSYIRAGDSLIVSGLTTGFCWGNDLISRPGVSFRDTFPFFPDKEYLSLEYGGMSGTSSADGSDTVTWKMYTVYLRQGAGSDLKGLWRIIGERAELVKGNPTPDQQSSLDVELGFDAEVLAAFPSLLEFDDARMIYYTHPDLAGKFLYHWNHSRPGLSTDSGTYAVQVKAIGKAAVELKGKKTGETVRIGISADNSRRYTSDFPSHRPYSFDAKPTTCPNNFTPSWYDQFLQDNVRGPVPFK